MAERQQNLGKQVSGSTEPPVVEPQSERYSHEDFLNKLYGTVLDWLVKDEGGLVVAEYGLHARSR